MSSNLTAPTNFLQVSELDSTAALRARLLAYCDEQHGRVRFREDRTGSSKRIAQGIAAARALIESTALQVDAQAYLHALGDALEKEKERLRRDADDEDGWALGGMTTILERVELERAGPGAFEIAFEPQIARQISRYVARSFFSPRELPQAAARMVLTREFGIFAGIPLVLLLVARFAPETFSQALVWIAVLWLLAGLVRIARYGRARGIGCFVRNADGSRGARVGGLRMRLEKGARRLWIAGLLVEPHARGHGVGTALVLAAFKLALREADQGPVTVKVFAPSHPASKRIVSRQLGGAQAVVVSQPLSNEARRVIERLEASLEKSFTWTFAEPARLFGP